jgi:hypothetical protein
MDRSKCGSENLDLKTGMVSTEDNGEIWEESKEESMEKVRGRTFSRGKTRP